ncbi:type VI secretion system baseplate subunit TssG [Malaciobacter molluscorum LMG 25693]|uniref:Type VI secretion system baseplate subunit TssG n=1 Tax=Malaciobacter molluscorum LMG 25693 TaxID=870501 RepID=A0A2G1DHY9_9BACT|nr:type VI secretion system baseplate subunit TssG [Malaciobacter molluscorum]AXX92435.1 type VI secretion system, baseplate protein [Malaciobacter molluscorum LMG 25693]PHO18119.1 type VI secretion system baseplate subunit TssG [Malaciobacter molluscorum LMG 25693]
MNINSINSLLNENISKYTLPQIIRVICGYLKEHYINKTSLEVYEYIRFKSNPSLSFQKSEIAKVEFVEEKNLKVEVTLNFLSIFGSASPMPSHYSEMVLDSLDNDKVLYDFLNLFNHHLQKFVYPIWQNYRYYIQYQNDLSDRFSKYVFSFLGLYSNRIENNSSLNLKKLLPYIGILCMKHKSSGTLKSILRHYLDHKNLEIIQCVKDKYEIPSWQQSKLGENNCGLNSSFLIGEFVESRNAKFQILLKNVKNYQLVEYSILGKKMKELKELISFSLNEPLKHEICFEIKKEEKTCLNLENNKNQFLGINTWIGQSFYDEKIIIAQKGE